MTFTSSSSYSQSGYYSYTKDGITYEITCDYNSYTKDYKIMLTITDNALFLTYQSEAQSRTNVDF